MYLVIKPGAHPLDELAVSLANAKRQDNIARLRDSLAVSSREFHLQTRGLLQAQSTEARVCIVIDQFEEVFTLCQDQKERSQFIDALRYAVTVAGGQSVFLLTMRADFLTHAIEYKSLAELLSTHQFLLGPMDRDNLYRACEEPAHHVGLKLEDGLTDAILDDVDREPGLLPLMEDTLFQLWERRVDKVMTLQAYQELGGVRGALAKKADNLFTTLSPQQQAIARRVFLQLTQPGERTEDTRRRATMAELQTEAVATEAVADVVQRLTNARLLVTSKDQQVDVAHEALIRGWPKLQNWIEEDRTALRTHRRITEAAAEWQRLHRDAGVLFRGVLLTVAQEWREKHAADLSLPEREFLDASMTLRQDEEREHDRARREREELLEGNSLAQLLRRVPIQAGLVGALTRVVLSWVFGSFLVPYEQSALLDGITKSFCYGLIGTVMGSALLIMLASNVFFRLQNEITIRQAGSIALAGCVWGFVVYILISGDLSRWGYVITGTCWGVGLAIGIFSGNQLGKNSSDRSQLLRKRYLAGACGTFCFLLFSLPIMNLFFTKQIAAENFGRRMWGEVFEQSLSVWALLFCFYRYQQRSLGRLQNSEIQQI